MTNCGCASCDCNAKAVKWCECGHERKVHTLDDYTTIWKCQYVADGVKTCNCRKWRDVCVT